LRGDRLMELFDKASARFRGAFRDLLGYRVDVRPSDEYKVRPVFASDSSEYLMFQKGIPPELTNLLRNCFIHRLQYTEEDAFDDCSRIDGQLVLKENQFSQRLSDDIRAYLGSTASYPGFFAALTLSYVQQTTMVA
uniref:Capsid protein n=1 Tax=Echinostoma caproni TaxID=27848 RepID=A0A183AWT8_9TREM